MADIQITSTLEYLRQRPNVSCSLAQDRELLGNVLKACTDVVDEEKRSNYLSDVQVLACEQSFSQLVISLCDGGWFDAIVSRKEFLRECVQYGMADLLAYQKTERQMDIVSENEDVFGRSLLQQACVWGYFDVVHLLLVHGADPGAKDKDGKLAVQLAQERDYFEIGILLLENLSPQCDNTADNQQLLRLAVLNNSICLVRMLLDRGVDVNGLEKGGCTALGHALRHSHLDMFYTLIDYSASLGHQDEAGNGPLHYVATRQYAADAHQLTYPPPLAATSVRSAFINTVSSNYALYSALSPTQRNSAQDNYRISVNGTLALNPDLDTVQNNSCTLPMRPSVVESDTAIVISYVTEDGSVQNVFNFVGNSPLEYAVCCDNVSAAKGLIVTKADVNVFTAHGETLLMYAVKLGREEIVRLLLTSGADPNGESVVSLDFALPVGLRSGVVTQKGVLAQLEQQRVNTTEDMTPGHAFVPLQHRRLLRDDVTPGLAAAVLADTRKVALPPLFAILKSNFHLGTAELLLRNAARINFVVSDSLSHVHMDTLTFAITHGAPLDCIHWLVTNGVFIQPHRSNANPLLTAVRLQRYDVALYLLYCGCLPCLTGTEEICTTPVGILSYRDLFVHISSSFEPHAQQLVSPLVAAVCTAPDDVASIFIDCAATLCVSPRIGAQSGQLSTLSSMRAATRQLKQQKPAPAVTKHPYTGTLHPTSGGLGAHGQFTASYCLRQSLAMAIALGRVYLALRILEKLAVRLFQANSATLDLSFLHNSKNYPVDSSVSEPFPPLLTSPRFPYLSEILEELPRDSKLSTITQLLLELLVHSVLEEEQCTYVLFLMLSIIACQYQDSKSLGKLILLQPPNVYCKQCTTKKACDVHSNPSKQHASCACVYHGCGAKCNLGNVNVLLEAIKTDVCLCEFSGKASTPLQTRMQLPLTTYLVSFACVYNLVGVLEQMKRLQFNFTHILGHHNAFPQAFYVPHVQSDRHGNATCGAGLQAFKVLSSEKDVVSARSISPFRAWDIKYVPNATALEVACAHEHDEVVLYLLHHFGSQLSLTRPLLISLRQGNEQHVTWLTSCLNSSGRALEADEELGHPVWCAVVGESIRNLHTVISLSGDINYWPKTSPIGPVPVGYEGEWALAAAITSRNDAMVKVLLLSGALVKHPNAYKVHTHLITQQHMHDPNVRGRVSPMNYQVQPLFSIESGVQGPLGAQYSILSQITNIDCLAYPCTYGSMSLRNQQATSSHTRVDSVPEHSFEFAYPGKTHPMHLLPQPLPTTSSVIVFALVFEMYDIAGSLVQFQYQQDDFCSVDEVLCFLFFGKREWIMNIKQKEGVVAEAVLRVKDLMLSKEGRLFCSRVLSPELLDILISVDLKERPVYSGVEDVTDKSIRKPAPLPLPRKNLSYTPSAMTTEQDGVRQLSTLGRSEKHNASVLLAKGRWRNPVIQSWSEIMLHLLTLDCTLMPQFLEVFISADISLNYSDGAGNTAMHIALGKHHMDVVRLLIDRKVCLNRANCVGLTPLMIAAREGYTDVVLQMIVDCNVDVNIRRNNGWTALMYAAQSGYVENVKVLLDAGADPTVITPSGCSALAFAEDGDFEDIVDLLTKEVQSLRTKQ